MFFLLLLIHLMFSRLFLLMIRRPPRSTRTDTLFPYTTLFRSQHVVAKQVGVDHALRQAVPVERHLLRKLIVDQFADRCFRSEEHTSELQSLMRISYAVFCLKKKTNIINTYDNCVSYIILHKISVH